MSKDYVDAQGRFHADPFKPEMRTLRAAEAAASDKCADLRRRAEKAERERDELLASLEEVVEFWVAMNPGIQGAPLADARAAIARAKGETP